MPPPFQPLVEQSASQVQQPVDTGQGFEQIYNQGGGSQQYQARELDRQQTIQRAQQGAGEVTGLEKVLSIAAALSGNFGPAIQLGERQRRTKIGRAVQPIVTKVQNLIAVREHDEAERLIGEAYSHFGPQSPEVAQYLISLSNQNIKTKRESLSDKAMAKLLKNVVPKEALNRRFVDAFSDAANSNAPFDRDLLKVVFQHAIGVKTQPTEQGILQSQELTGTTKREAFEKFEKISDYDPLLVQKASADFRMTPTEIQNTLNIPSGGQPVVVNGKTLTSADAESLKGYLTTGQQLIARLTLGSKLQRDPQTILAALQRHGVIGTLTGEFGRPSELFPQSQTTVGPAPSSVEQQALTSQSPGSARYTVEGGQQVTQGIGTPGTGAGSVLTDIYERATEQERAKIRAQYQSNVAAPRQIGLVETVVDPADPDYGSEGPATSFADMKGQKRLRHISKDDRDKYVTPLIAAGKALGAVNALFKERGEPGSLLGRAGTGVANLFSDYTGVYFNENDTLAKVNQFIVTRAIEDIERTGKIDDALVGAVKAAAAGGFTDSKAGRRAVQRLQQRIYQQLEQFVGKGNVPPVELFGLDEIFHKAVGSDETDPSAYKAKPRR